MRAEFARDKKPHTRSVKMQRCKGLKGKSEKVQECESVRVQECKSVGGRMGLPGWEREEELVARELGGAIK